MKNIHKLFLVVAVMSLNGCATQQFKWEREALSKQGQPPEYIDGYEDGCSSGAKAAGNPYFHFTKDVKRFHTDYLYAQGWHNGFDVCKGKYESIGR